MAIRIKILSIIALFISMNAFSQSLRFAILTDTHIGKPDGLSKMADAIESINTDKEIQFVLHLGDITDHGTEEELALAKDLLSKLKKPLYFTTGNHDARWPERREAFIKVFKKDRFCFKNDGIRFIGCCTGPYETIKRATIKQEDLEWIAKKCKKNRPTVVALHYPHDSVYNRDELDKALGNSDVILWLAGHMRFNTIKSEYPYPCLIDISQLEDAKYNLVTIKGSELSIEVVSPREGTVTHWYNYTLNIRLR
ncbi:MAG: metallophosphoesterase family protein [Candidatus Cryptobacteroides sp.]